MSSSAALNASWHKASTHAGLIALTDCNCFYVSAHRLFEPQLIGRSVVALSNGDGNVVSRSNEAKALGIRMAQPWFELKNLVQRHGLVGRSSQYCLYGEVSNRVLDVMRKFSPVDEPYSIDENFISLGGMGNLWPSPTAMGRAGEEKAAFEAVMASALPPAVSGGQPQQFKLVLGEIWHIELPR